MNPCTRRAPRCIARTFSPRARSAIVIAAIAFVLTGCATNHAMMPTPVLYTGANAKPLFTELSIDSRRPPLDLLFITDRAPAGKSGDMPYTAGRSRSMAFGSAIIEFGEDVSWDVLVKESTATQRVNPLQLKLGPTTELGHFPPIPYEVIVAPDGIRRVLAVVEAYKKAKQQLQAEIARRLVIARRKEVVLFVHGYHSSFESAALTMGELCHFLGREFVCGIFTWPAGGRRGILFGYDVDRESSEYAIQDLLKAIRIVARTPGVERIHFIAHSRGADTLASALAELGAEAHILQSSPDREFHLGNVVLVAPDLDGDVALTKIFRSSPTSLARSAGKRTRAPSSPLHLATGSHSTFRRTTRRSRRRAGCSAASPGSGGSPPPCSALPDRSDRLVRWGSTSSR